jgi:hypothetical protein
MKSHQETHLTTGWAGKELAQRYKSAVPFAAQPLSLPNVRALEVSEVRDRAAE